MQSQELVISVLRSAERPIDGRTALQKLSYFASLRTNDDMGFRAHFYGPYSPLVASTLSDLVTLDYVQESKRLTGQDRLLYSYELTDDGNVLARRIERDVPREFSEVTKAVTTCESIVGNDIDALSWAAKVFFILKLNNREISYKRVRDEGERLGWKLTNGQVETGTRLLEALNLAQASRSG